MLSRIDDFLTFDFDEFSQGKVFAIREVDNWTSFKKDKYGNKEHYGVVITVDIVIDDYDYGVEDSEGNPKDVTNVRKEFYVKVDDSNKTAQDYEYLIGGLQRIPVKVICEGTKVTGTSRQGSTYVDRKLNIYGDVVRLESEHDDNSEMQMEE